MDKTEITIEAGKSYKVRLKYNHITYKVYVDHILPSVYENENLIIYRWYGKHKQWWHEEMCTEQEFLRWLEFTNEEKK